MMDCLCYFISLLGGDHSLNAFFGTLGDQGAAGTRTVPGSQLHPQEFLEGCWDKGVTAGEQQSQGTGAQTAGVCETGSVFVFS